MGKQSRREAGLSRGAEAGRPVAWLCALMAWAGLMIAPAPALAHSEDSIASARATVANLRRITTPNGVQELYEVTLGGAPQWISIHGRDRANPVLLFVHGGPGAPEMPLAWTFQSPWEDYFTVVQWDQRGAGKSYRGPDAALSADRIVADGGELIAHLRERLGVRKVIILGQSWGSYVGLRMALANPESVAAYVGTGQIIKFAEGERVGYEWTVRQARQTNNAEALADLRGILPYPEPDGSIPVSKIDIERRWSVYYGALMYGRDAYDFYSAAARLSPEYEPDDVPKIGRGSAQSLAPLIRDLQQADFGDVRSVPFPVVLLLGRQDYTTPSQLAANWLASLRAPHKKVVWFENSAHLVPLEEPGRFLLALVQYVRPLAAPGR